MILLLFSSRKTSLKDSENRLLNLLIWNTRDWKANFEIHYLEKPEKGWCLVLKNRFLNFFFCLSLSMEFVAKPWHSWGPPADRGYLIKSSNLHLERFAPEYLVGILQKHQEPVSGIQKPKHYERKNSGVFKITPMGKTSRVSCENWG